MESNSNPCKRLHRRDFTMYNRYRLDVDAAIRYAFRVVLNGDRLEGKADVPDRKATPREKQLSILWDSHRSYVTVIFIFLAFSPSIPYRYAVTIYSVYNLKNSHYSARSISFELKSLLNLRSHTRNFSIELISDQTER